MPIANQRIVLTLACALLMAASLFAQKPLADKDLLASFEKEIDQGRYSEVEGPLLKFVVSRPQMATGYELLARLRLRQQRLNEARSLYQKSLAIEPALVRARIDLSITLLGLGETAASREILNSITLDATTAAKYGLRFAESLILVKDFERALRTIDLLPPGQKNGAALPFRAEAYIALGQREKISDVIRLAKVSVRTDSRIAVGVAGVLMGTEFSKQAGDLLSAVVLLSPKNVQALLLLAGTKIHERDLASARVHVAKATSLAPDSAEAAILLATIESELGNQTEAFNAFERGLELAPASIEVKTKAVITAMRAKKPRRAVEIAREILAARPDDPDSMYLFGAASLQAGRIVDAEDYLGRFVAERPNDGRGCVAYSLSLAAQPDKVEAARRKLEDCAKLDPNNFEATYQLALSHRSSGETARAIEYLERTVNLSPNYVYAVRDLGVLYLQAGNESQARVKLEKAVKLAPADADTHFQLSRLYNLAGRPDLAKQHFDTFQKLRSSNEN